MKQRYYRVHWDGRSATGRQAFTAENAWSRPWGSDAVIDEDGAPSLYTCIPCDATGLLPDLSAAFHPTIEPQYDEDRGGWICPACRGAGAREADRGYSCLSTLEDLTAEYAVYSDPDAEIVEFEGDLHGYGCDGEPLVVPTRVVSWMTLEEARTEQGQRR